MIIVISQSKLLQRAGL